jgi:hypothetical protein
MVQTTRKNILSPSIPSLSREEGNLKRISKLKKWKEIGLRLLKPLQVSSFKKVDIFF